MPKAILFDLDDTLLEYESVLDSWRATLSAFATELPAANIDEAVRWIGEYSDWYWRDPERNRQGRLDMTAARTAVATAFLREFRLGDDHLAARIGFALNARREAEVRLYQDAQETLTELHRRGVTLALITNGHSTPQREKIERFALGAYFAHVQIEGEFGFGKPDERVYRHVLDRLAVDAAQAWMIGDNLEWDVAGPQRLGIHGIWFNPLDKSLPVGNATRPDRTIRRLSELLE